MGNISQERYKQKKKILIRQSQPKSGYPSDWLPGKGKNWKRKYSGEEREIVSQEEANRQMKGKTEHSKYLRHESEEEEKKKNEKIEIWRWK
jgi:hypothetical protein